MAARTGLDPLLVRGIVIVIAVLGGPVVLAYAVGWALLPDARGLIHAEEAVNKRFTPPMIAIGLIALFSVTPLWRGFWFEGVPFGWGMPGWLGTTLHTLWIVGLCVGTIWLIITVARKLSGRQPSAPGSSGQGPAGSAPAGSGSAWAPDGRYPDDGRYNATPRPARADRSTANRTTTTPATAAYGSRSATATVHDASPETTSPEPGRARPVADTPAGGGRGGTGPLGMPSNATTGRSDGFDQHDRAAGPDSRPTTAQYASTTGGSFDWNQHVTEPLNQAAKATREAFTPPPAREPQLRTRSASGAYVAIVLGLALVAAAVAGAYTAAATHSNALFPAAVAALAVVAIGIVISGIRGRTSGALSPFAILLAIVLAFTGIFPAGTQVGLVGSRTFVVSEVTPSANSGYVMLAGNVVLDATNVTPDFTGRATVDLWVGAGNITVIIPEGLPVEAQANAAGGNVTFQSTTPVTRRGALLTTAYLFNNSAIDSALEIRVWTLGGNINFIPESKR